MADRSEHDNQTSSLRRISMSPRGPSSRMPPLLAQLLGAVHVCITGFVKTQQPIYIARDADADAFANPANPLRGRGQPKRAGSAQVRSVLAELNPQCLGQSPRTSAEVGQACRAARTGHHFVDAL